MNHSWRKRWKGWKTPKCLYIILLTNNRRGWKHNLLGWGNMRDSVLCTIPFVIIFNHYSVSLLHLAPLLPLIQSSNPAAPDPSPAPKPLQHSHTQQQQHTHTPTHKQKHPAMNSPFLCFNTYLTGKVSECKERKRKKNPEAEITVSFPTQAGRISVWHQQHWCLIVQPCTRLLIGHQLFTTQAISGISTPSAGRTKTRPKDVNTRGQRILCSAALTEWPSFFWTSGDGFLTRSI